jgi:pyruvate-ferredoxin/flavodoxin oxidoreductase
MSASKTATPASRTPETIDGNEAAARVAYHLSDVIAIYPITPSSPMGEWADQWAYEGRPNLWGQVPRVVEMQSEAGAAGTIHGALQGGALATTFTASQGLLLMIPNMYKMAGELTAVVMHVAARSLATHALSIFGDHSDVMAARSTGWALLASSSVQEAADLAVVAHSAALESRVPVLHFFDGFRTSHELITIDSLRAEDVRAMIRDELVAAHRARALSPDHPVIRGTAQNPDVYFQAREACNPFYRACPAIVQASMDALAARTGRPYKLFDYYGAPDAEHVVVLMGSGIGAVRETLDALRQQGRKVGAVCVRLYRPFSVEHFLEALPRTTRAIAVLDRTKEPGSIGEPLYLDVVAALYEGAAEDRWPPASLPTVIGGRYGLSSKEFTPAMARGVFEALAAGTAPRHFTIGIRDDVTHASLPYDPAFSTESPEVLRAVFYGLGSDGTVGANKNTIKIVGRETSRVVQGYFVYDSKKAGSVTVSHLRFSPHPIQSTYLIREANVVACHQFSLLERLDVLACAAPGGTVLLNSPHGPQEVWARLPRRVQEALIAKRLRLFVIDAYRIAREVKLPLRINTIMQVAFFKVTDLLPAERAVSAIKQAIATTYGKRGEAVVRQNQAAVDAALAHLHEVAIPRRTNGAAVRPVVPPQAPKFVREVLGPMLAGEGDELPVSRLPVDGTFQSGTAKWEKRGIGAEIPVWDEALCIQCGKCVLVCPHAVIRAKVCDGADLAGVPETFKSAPAKWAELKGRRYTLQVGPEDCTGCSLCVQVCPAKSKSQASRKAINMEPQEPIRERERAHWDAFIHLPQTARTAVPLAQVKNAQLLEPLFEFSGACAGCGETPYIKLMSQLFGDRALVANATGCSSIYGGNLPTTPWTTNAEGRGPAWANSLFEDNAEFGLGMRLALDQQAAYARELVRRLAGRLGQELVAGVLEADDSTEQGLAAKRERVAALVARLHTLHVPEAKELLTVAGALVRKSVWLIGGDGWAYDIGFGGLDHVLASPADVNILVLDTEVYSNTGGQMSKATPRGAVAKFAASGKQARKKDLGLIAMTYGSAYVARVAMGANDQQTLTAFREAERYPGPSLIIAYSHCIAHGYNMAHGMEQQAAAVRSGYWPLFRYDPSRAQRGEPPFQLDSGRPALPLKDYVYNETRYTMLVRSDPAAAARLLTQMQEDVAATWRAYEHLARADAAAQPATEAPHA